jgi:hypothetical protein
MSHTFAPPTSRKAAIARRPTSHAPATVASPLAVPLRAGGPLAAGRFDYSRIPVYAEPGVVPAVQAKRVVNEPGDVYEQEADRVADALMDAPLTAGGPARRLADPSSARIQQKCAECEQEENDEETVPVVQMKAARTTEPADGFKDRLRALSGGGSPLPDDQRREFEAHLGYDLSGVRVHTDSAAATAAGSLGARAFTHGHAIAFATGQYAPETTAGRRLLAHELTHVVQQSTGGLMNRAGTAAPAPVQRSLWDEFTGGLQSATGSITETAREAGGAVMSRASAAQQYLGDKVERAEAYASEKAERAEAYVGEKATAVGHAVSEEAGAAKEALVKAAASGARLLDEVREKICTSPAECIGKAWLRLTFEQKVAVADWMLGGAAQIVDKFPREGLGFLWPLVRAALLGFLRQLQGAKNETKIAAFDKIAVILAGRSPEFNKAFLQGFLKGFFIDGLFGPVVMVKDLIEGLPQAWKLLKQVEEAIEGFPDDMKAMYEEFVRVGGELAQQVGPALEELKQLATDPARAAAAANDLAAQAEKLSAKAGGGLAQLFLDFLSQQGAEAQIGETAGNKLGNATFEIVAAVVTAGGSTAVTGGKTALKEALTFLRRIGGKIVHGFVEIFREGAALLSKGVTFIKDVARLLKEKALKVLGGIGERVGSVVEKVKGFFAKLAGSCHESKLVCNFKTKKEQAEESARALQEYLARGGEIKRYELGESARTGIHYHHVFPSEFEEVFKAWGIKDIDEFTVAIKESKHTLVHHPAEGSTLEGWNQEWKEFIDHHKREGTKPSVIELHEKMELMRKKHGIADHKLVHYRVRRQL